MRPLLAFAAAALIATPAFALKPLREQSPAPKELLNPLGIGGSDEALDKAIAAAQGRPLGSAANPIRVGGPLGERAYVARLRCADGKAPRIGQPGPAGVGAFGSIVDIYPLDCGATAPGKVDLVMDKYHDEHEETRPAAGFTILPR